MPKTKKLIGDDSAASKAVREALETQPVTRARYPKWLLDAIKAAVKGEKLPKPDAPLLAAGTALDHATRHLGDAWADHVGKMTYDGYELLVAEPYADRVDLEFMQQLDRFCKAIDARYTISANSFHFPGATIRVIISPNSRIQISQKNNEWHGRMVRRAK